MRYYILDVIISPPSIPCCLLYPLILVFLITSFAEFSTQTLPFSSKHHLCFPRSSIQLFLSLCLLTTFLYALVISSPKSLLLLFWSSLSLVAHVQFERISFSTIFSNTNFIISIIRSSPFYLDYTLLSIC